MVKELPDRKSLITQTVKVIVDSLESGEWGEFLPPEIELSRQLQVSRNTVRLALAALERDGWIGKAKPGVRRQILRTVAHPADERHKLVVYLAPVKLSDMRRLDILIIDDLRDLLSRMDCQLKVFSSRAYMVPEPGNTLEALMRKIRGDLWVVQRSTREMQEWLAGQKTPVLLHGSPHPGIELPSVDQDFEAVARHAAGRLLAKGHTSVALICPPEDLIGNERMKSGFLSAFSEHPGETHERIVLWQDAQGGPLETFYHSLDELFGTDHPPTAIVVTRFQYLLTTMSYLNQKRLQVPADVSLVCMDYNELLDFFIPRIDHYRSRSDQVVDRTIKKIQDLLMHGQTSTEPILILPECVEGESIRVLS